MLGVCYYPEHWPEDLWEDDARRMAELGIAYVRIGEFAWSRIEPEPGRFDWAWLDRAVEVLGSQGLKVVMGTPTATPPKWLVDRQSRHPTGICVGSGAGLRLASPLLLLVEDLLERESSASSKRSPAVMETTKSVAGWQTDNEYGCHSTVLSWGPEDLAAFRQWLRRHYQTPEALNVAWGNVFWSQEVRDFRRDRPPPSRRHRRSIPRRVSISGVSPPSRSPPMIGCRSRSCGSIRQAGSSPITSWASSTNSIIGPSNTSISPRGILTH